MAKVLISILSDNLIGNFLFFKEKEKDFDKQIFITTPEMRNKGVGHNLEDAMGFEHDSIERIEVPNDCCSDVIAELDGSGLSSNDEYWVNETGGTKPMSIAVFQFFQNFKARFVYFPIGGRTFVDLSDKSFSYPITYQLSLKEYLSLYGIRYESDSKITHGVQLLHDIFNKVKKSNWRLPDNLKNADTFYEKPEDKVFYKGTWFEEYSYMRIKHDFNLRDDQIALSAKLYRKDSLVNDNEIDVIYVKDNLLNIVECKVSMFGNYAQGKVNAKDTVTDYLYKLAAISKDLGLRVNAYLFTLHKMSFFPETTIDAFEKRAKILGLKGIFDGNKLAKSPLKLNDENKKAVSKTANVKETAVPINHLTHIDEEPIKFTILGKIDLDKI